MLAIYGQSKQECDFDEEKHVEHGEERGKIWICPCIQIINDEKGDDDDDDEKGDGDDDDDDLDNPAPSLCLVTCPQVAAFLSQVIAVDGMIMTIITIMMLIDRDGDVGDGDRDQINITKE